MFIETVRYHVGEARWRVKESVRSALARIDRQVGPSAGESDVQTEIGYSHLHLASARDQMLLRDYVPESMLCNRVSNVIRARFPVIDVHCHLNDGIVMRKHVDPKHFVSVMDKTNVRAAVNLTGGWDEKLQRSVNMLAEAFPGRFFVFCQIDYRHLDDSAYLIDMLDRAWELGAKGVKVLKDLGLTVRDRNGHRVRIDDPRLDCVWERAGKLGMPVGIHTADPDAFFARVDRHNERYQELVVHPDWSYVGKKLPCKSDLLAQRNRVFERHPGTCFWGLHMANHPENLDEVSEWMERYPNLHVELGGRIAELGRQPRRTKKFLCQYQDRVMFGMDTALTEDCYRGYFRFLESEDEYFDYPGSPWQGRWKIYGLGLPDDVLRKLYHDNAARQLGVSQLAQENAYAPA